MLEVRQQSRARSPRASTAEDTVGNQAVDALKTAFMDALAVFKRLALNPVGELPRTYHSLGPQRALGAGIVFGLVFVLCVTVTIVMNPLYKWLLFIQDFVAVKVFFSSLVPFVTLIAAAFTSRKVASRVETGITGDVFMVGAALLPLGLCVLIGGIIGWDNIEVIWFLGFLSTCVTILMFYSGNIGIAGLTDRAATIAVPVMLVLSAWLTKVVFKGVFSAIVREI